VAAADVYCFGHVTTGVVLRLQGRYPAPDTYGEVAETLENHAGEATGTALVLARLGVSVTLEGNWLGDNPTCRRTLDFLQARGIDCSGLVVKPGYPGVTEVVVSDGETRTVFGRFVDLLFTTPQWDPPNLAQARAARFICVDPAFGAATAAVAQAALAAGRPLATYDVRPDSALAAQSAVLAISLEFLRREYPEAARAETVRAELFADYLAYCPGLVVFTAGARPLWYGRGQAGVGGHRHELPVFPVNVIDTAGAGDSLRGGLIYGLLQGWSDDDTVRFAAAVSALICTTAPGCVQAPALDQVHALLAAHGGPSFPSPPQSNRATQPATLA
jgi:sugar/nucleoside kinase (ribokinase family)